MATFTGSRLVVLDPTSDIVPSLWSLADRLASLDGKTVAFLSNGKRNADQILLEIERLLRAQYRLGGSVHLTKPDVGRVIPDSLADDLAGRVDVVVTGVGD